MDSATKLLKGSPSRDTFKQKHKQLSNKFYACDIDFVLVQKTPIPDIVAAVDYKSFGDSVTFSEVVAYNALIYRGIDVFLVYGDREANGPFDVYRYIGGHHHAPIARTVLVESKLTWQSLAEWEDSIRGLYAERFSA